MGLRFAFRVYVFLVEGGNCGWWEGEEGGKEENEVRSEFVSGSCAKIEPAGQVRVRPKKVMRGGASESWMKSSERKYEGQCCADKANR